MALGLAFEGCAGRAAFHAGVVDGLHRAGVAPACVAGASSGSIVAALVAAGLPDRLVDIWRSASDQPVFRPRRILRGRWPFAMSQIVGDALESVFQERRLESLALPIAIPVTLVGVRGRRRRILTREDDISVVEAVLASCFIPGPYSRVVAIDRCLAVEVTQGHPQRAPDHQQRGHPEHEQGQSDAAPERAHAVRSRGGGTSR